jgi:hypothetical protein
MIHDMNDQNIKRKEESLWVFDEVEEEHDDERWQHKSMTTTMEAICILMLAPFCFWHHGSGGTHLGGVCDA